MSTLVNFDEIKAKVTGVRRAGYALVTKNTKDSLTHGEIKYLSRARKVAIAPSYGESELDSNDAVEAEGNEIMGYTVTLDASGMDQETEAEIYGHRIDSNGIMVEEEGDEPPKVALLLELAMSGGGSKYVTLFCGSAKHPTEEAESKTKSSFTYSLPSIEFSFTKAMNGLLKTSTRTDAKNYSKEIGDAWFDEVKYPANAEG